MAVSESEARTADLESSMVVDAGPALPGQPVPDARPGSMVVNWASEKLASGTPAQEAPEAVPDARQGSMVVHWGSEKSHSGTPAQDPGVTGTSELLNDTSRLSTMTEPMQTSDSLLVSRGSVGQNGVGPDPMSRPTAQLDNSGHLDSVKEPARNIDSLLVSHGSIDQNGMLVPDQMLLPMEPVGQTSEPPKKNKDSGRAKPMHPKQQSFLNEIEMFSGDYMLPLGFMTHGLKQATRDDIVKRGCADFVLTLLFIIILLLANPVTSVFEIQDAISQSLARAPINATGMRNETGLRSKRDFYAIKDYADFWSWTSTVLYPRVYDSVSQSSKPGHIDTFTIARYNRLISPLRFRQVRLKEQECGVPEDNHALARPCWSSFQLPNLGILSNFGGLEIQEAGSTAAPNSTFVKDGMPMLLGEQEDLTTSYGTGGHVVDLDLDPAVALSKLNGMIKARWTDESTQVVAVDVNTYNPNYDIVTVFRFTVTQTIGGKLLPQVETCSCRLNVYSDLVSSLVSLEGFWAVLFLLYVVLRISWWCYEGIRRSFRRSLSWVQLFNMLWFFAIGVLFVSHGLQDRTAFKSRNVSKFQDVYSACQFLHIAANFASLSMILACLQLLAGLKVYPGFSKVCRLLDHSMNMALPFVFVVILGVLMFSFSAMWLFGSQVEGLQTWYHALGVLAHSLATGKYNLYVYEKMSDSHTSVAGIWMVVWIVMSTLLFGNMFVSLLTSTVFTVSKQIPHEEMLERTFPPLSFLTYLRSKVPCLWRDPDLFEPIRMLLIEVKLWKAHLYHVDIDKLQSLVRARVAQGKTLLRIEDVMTLFPDKDEEQSYKKAAVWIQSLSQCLGVKMQEAEQRRTLLFEAELLTQGVSKLEEEIYGLGLQLRRVLPNGAPKARMI